MKDDRTDRRYRVRSVVALTMLTLIIVSIWTTSRSVNRQPVNIVRKANDANESFDANWPQFRGPTFDAISLETNLADSWPDDGPEVVWTRELGEGYSSFIAAGRHVFTQYQSLYQQLVVCLDAESGQTVWTHAYGWPYDGGGLYPGPRSTPTWDNDRLYFAAPDGLIGCLNARTGDSIWSVNPKKQFHGRGTDFGYASSPVVVEGKVIVPVGGQGASVVALNAADGSLVWTAGDSSASYATPLPISWRGKRRVVVPLENSIASFDIESGTQLWENEFSQGYDEHSAAPIYSEPFLCIASPFRAGAKCYRLVDRAGGETKPHLDQVVNAAPAFRDEVASVDSNRPAPVEGAIDLSSRAKTEITQVVWESPRFSNDVCSSVLVDGRLYGFDLKDPQSRMNRPSKGTFRCLDFKTGNVIWSTDRVGQSTMIAADRKLILFTDNGELILARLGTDEYSELARTTVFKDEICWTSPALHRGRLYLRTQTRAACIDLRNAPEPSGRPIGRVRDIPHGRMLDARTLIGGERELPATVPTAAEFTIWYFWGLVSLVLASVSAFAVWMVAKGLGWILRTLRRRLETAVTDNRQQDRSDLYARGSFWLIVTIAGAIGSPLINALQSEYVLLWPLVLWVVFQLTVNVIIWAERQTNRWWPRWISRATVVLFICTCLLYFSLCRGLGYAIEWAFLIGFLPAFIIAAFAARWLTSRHRFWLATDVLFAALSWTAYFWSSVLFITWRLKAGT